MYFPRYSLLMLALLTLSLRLTAVHLAVQQHGSTGSGVRLKCIASLLVHFQRQHPGTMISRAQDLCK